MQLQTHYEALKYFLKIVKDCAEGRKEISNLDGFIDDKLPMILKITFSKETEDLKNVLVNACNSIRMGISRSQDYFKSSIIRILESALRARSRGELEETETSTPRDFAQPIMDAVGGLMRNLVAAMDLFSHRSFEAAFLVALKLKEIEESRESRPISVTVRDEDRIRIHPVWSSLADKGYNLLFRIPDFDNVHEDLLNLLKGMYEKLKNRKDEVHDAIYDTIYKRDRKKLSNLVYNALDTEKDLKNVVADYVVGHLAILGEQLDAAEEFTTDNLEKYLETVFGGNCFLEYEVYAALLEHGVPALPRLIISATDASEEELGAQEGTASKSYQELDVVARVGDELWLVEVTTSKNRQDLEDKAKNLSELMSWLGAEKALIVCTKEAREISKQLPEYEGVAFRSFGGLCSELQKLLKKSTKRRRPALHQELPSLFQPSAS